MYGVLLLLPAYTRASIIPNQYSHLRNIKECCKILYNDGYALPLRSQKNGRDPQIT